MPFRDRNAEHFAHQQFGQVPWLTDEEISIFESGAILLHLAQQSKALLPSDSRGRAAAINWLFAALNSVEMPSVPWSLFKFFDDDAETPGRGHLDAFLTSRLRRMDAVLAERQWLTETFSIADNAMADVLRLVDRFDGLAEHPACRAYVARATGRPAFVKSYTDQAAHFAAADAAVATVLGQ